MVTDENICTNFDWIWNLRRRDYVFVSLYLGRRICVCRCLGHLVSIWVDTGGQPLLLSSMTPQVVLPHYSFSQRRSLFLAWNLLGRFSKWLGTFKNLSLLPLRLQANTTLSIFFLIMWVLGIRLRYSPCKPNTSLICQLAAYILNVFFSWLVNTE